MTVTPDQEATLASRDGRISLRLPAGSFNEEVRVEMKVVPPPASTGMRMVKLLDINAYAVKRRDAPVTSLLKDATIAITNTTRELRGLNYQSLKLYYLDPADRKWKPAASQFNPTTLTLTATTNHFTYYGEQADPVISGPPLIMAFEANMHSGTVKSSYPIELPPGPGGFKPRLQLVYDSGKADGMRNKRSLGSWVGIGWTLNAGYISYDEETNEYYLEIGSEGYEIFRSGNKYFVKPDLFYKITRDEANQKWEVWDRSGVYYRFGGAADSSQYYRKSDGPPVENVYYRWDLSLIKDAHNNQASVSYDQYVFNNSVRSAYPSQISYTFGNTVTFTSSYDENNPTDGYVRKDNPISVTGGVPVPKVMENRKLDSIQVSVNGVLTRKYTFAYTTTDRVYSSDYSGIYYSGTHTLSSITQVGADGSSSLPALSFSYQPRETFFRDSDNAYYTGNPGNPASFSWPRLQSLTNGYGATATFGYAQIPANTANNIWTRQAVTSRTINPGIGPNLTYSYQYGDDPNNPSLPEYLGYGWTARFRGFRKVKETDAAGNYTWRYFHTTGYDDVNNKDCEKITGRQYKTEQYDSGNNLLQTTTNNWKWETSWFWDIYKPEYTFLNVWDGLGSNDGYFWGPYGVAVDGGGKVYVSETGNNRMQKFTDTGGFVTRWGSAGNQNNQFNTPRGVAASSDGKVYVADSANHRIQKFESSGQFLLAWPSTSPYGVAVSPDGAYVYAVEVNLNRVTKYSNTGTVITSWGTEGSGDGQFQSPWGIATDSSGNVYVADTLNNRIQKFTDAGSFLGKFGSPGTADGQFNYPRGVAVDSSGNIYVADTDNHRIQKFSSGFAFLWKLGSYGSGNGQFNSPKNVAVQGTTYVFVSDDGNNRIQKVTAAGAYDSQWGSYASGSGKFSTAEDVAHYNNALTYVVDSTTHEVKRFDGDGKYLGRFGGQGSGNGQFNTPKGVGVGVEGSNAFVYVADTSNHRIQKFSSTGAWQATWGGYGSGNGQFSSPQDIAAAWDGAFVYVADTGNNRIQKFNSAGTYQTQWSVSQPTGVAVDGLGNVYVVDQLNSQVRKFDSSGQSQGNPWGGPGSGDGQFSVPTKIAADNSAPSVFVADKGNHRIQKFDSSGNFITKFGVLGADHGAFTYPQGIAISSDGDFIYVADTGNNRVQKLTYQWNVYLDQTEVTRTSKTSKTVYLPDGRGNVYGVKKYGDTGTADDDGTVFRLFANNQSAWILDRVKRERVYAGIKSSDDQGAGFKTETRYYYDGNADFLTDPTKGDLTKLEKRDPGTSQLINWQKTYDNYGNVKTDVDANGKTTSYDYDATYNTFLVKRTFPLIAGQSQAMYETYAWNYTGARMTSETDVNGQTTSYEYDTFWRPVKLIRPGDDSNSPTLQHQYNNWGTINYQHVNTTQKIDGSNNLWSKKYFDGLGRVVQVQAKGETGKSIVTTTAFNNRGLVDRDYVPQDLASPSAYLPPDASWKYSAYSYDALKRVVNTTKPDGTTVSHAYTDWQDLTTNERGKKKQYYFDPFERLIKVEEFDSPPPAQPYAATTYKYDVLNNLIEVKDAVTPPNTTTINYNAFSRKTSMTDPDMGTWSYVYDSQGNLTQQTDAKNQVLTFDYDEWNRLTAKKQGGAVITSYSYDDTSAGNYGKGRRTGMNDPNGQSGAMTYQYDTRGRLIEEKRTVDGTAYTTAYTYDAADRQATVTYPTGEVVTNGYNGRGLPYSLSSSVGGTIVSGTQYNNLALPTQVDLGNNTRTTYGYWNMGGPYDNPGNYYGKLWEIKTVKIGVNTLQDVKHTWDATGNLTERENVIEIEKETFGYDFLDRLTSSYNYLFTFGNTGGPPNTVSTPWKSAVDGNGNIWVADTGNNRIAKYNSSGVFQYAYGSYGTGDGQFDQPSGVTTAVIGNDLFVFVTDYNNHRIQKLRDTGSSLVFVAKWGVFGSGNGEFISPSDVVFNASNSYLYVSDTVNHRVQYFDANGGYQGQWGAWGSGDSQFKYPFGVGVDASGNIYVADMFNRKIKKFNSTGGWLATWGSSGSGPGQFQYPRDVAVDSSGNVFVADSSNHRIQKLNSSGVFITMWGSSGSGQSQFNNPYGVALSANRIYVVDTSNSRLQTFDSPTTAGWAYNQIGNMSLNDGKSYTYETKPHAVTQAGTSASYAYDANGNMTSRAGQTLTWDVENRLTAITGGVSYVYDGNGFRVKKTEGGVTTLYVNKYYEKNLSTSMVTLYYYLGDKMVALKEATTMRYVHQDHLTGTSTVTDASGNSIGSIKYKPYGETRSSSGTLPAHKFTGQRLDEVGLYYYGARYYDPSLARFISADSVVPGSPAGNSVVPGLIVDLTTGIVSGARMAPFSPQTLNRYSYVLDNPLRYTDPTGNNGHEGRVTLNPGPDGGGGGGGEGGGGTEKDTGTLSTDTKSDPQQPDNPADINPPGAPKAEPPPDPLTKTNDKVVSKNIVDTLFDKLFSLPALQGVKEQLFQGSRGYIDINVSLMPLTGGIQYNPEKGAYFYGGAYVGTWSVSVSHSQTEIAEGPFSSASISYGANLSGVAVLDAYNVLPADLLVETGLTIPGFSAGWQVLAYTVKLGPK